MTSTCLLKIENEVCVKFEGLDIATRRKLVSSLEFMIPYARHTPAFKLGKWNGKVSYCDIGGRSYLNLLDKLLPIVQQCGYDIEIEDLRASTDPFQFEKVVETSYEHIKWPQGHPRAGESVILKDHQVSVINCFLENATGVQVVPTGAGKTIVCSILSHKAEKYGRSIIIVPTKDLVVQTEEDYINFGLDVGVFYGDRKEYGKTHTICTWQSLESLSKRSKRDETVDIDKFFENVACVIVDETHKAKSDSLKKILSTFLANAPIRWGLTGTMPEEEFEKTAVIACVGPELGAITAKDLQERGILANLHINVWQLQDLGESAFTNYQAELKWLTTSLPRLKFLAKELLKVSETGNTLVLVDRIETGEILQELMPDSVFISGKMKSKDRKEEYKEVQEVDGKLLLATYGVASTGINVNRVFNLVLFEAGKSFVRVIQSIGRGIRVAKDKDFVNIYDVCSNSKFSKRHLTKRKKFYKDAQYPYTFTKVVY